MRFVDANVFVYAVVKPKGEAPEEIVDIKNRAKAIVKRIEEGEPVLTSVVHLSEVANVLEEHLRPEDLREYFNSILYKENVTVCAVDRELYRLANECFLIYDVGLNDALASIVMKREGINEIYSFDKHFDNIEWVKRLTC
jgi:predicted nucleic acid-binding protein